jgi:hypothetical protein
MRILIFFILISVPFIGSAQMTANGVLVATDASHANTDTDITFTGGNLLTVTQLKIATGATITGYLSGSGTLDFDLTSADTQDLTFTITGAADGDKIILGIPGGAFVAGVSFTYAVTAANTVTVRCSCLAPLCGANPASGTFKGSVIKD